ncbi:type II secretion system protein GspD [Candidatus Riflebacteria bacterium]
MQNKLYLLLFLTLFLNTPLFGQAAGGGGGGGEGGGAGNLREVKVLVKDTPENLKKIDSLIEQFDVPPLQVLTQVYIIQLKKTFERKLGVDWQGALTRVGSNNPESEFTSANGESAAADAKNIFRYGNLNTEHFEFLLRALENESQGRVISKPLVMTVSGKTSVVKLSTKEPYRTSTTNAETGNVTTTVNFMDVGITLDLTPTVFSDGNIHFRLTPTVSVKTGVFDNVPIIAETTATTEVMTPDNSSVIIGGLINQDLQKSKNNLPYFQRIPILRSIFAGRNKTEKDEEVVMVIHAKIIWPDRGRPAVPENLVRNLR